MLEATGLMVFYENMLALNNVAVQCDENQIVGVFGANSAGKSTLMYTLSGIMQDIRKKETHVRRRADNPGRANQFQGSGHHGSQTEPQGPNGDRVVS